MSNSEKILLIGYVDEETSELLSWIAYYRLRGVSTILVYVPPKLYQHSPLLKALMEAGHLQCLPLWMDTNEPAKATALLAQLDSLAPEGAICIAVQCGEYLKLGDNPQSFAETFLAGNPVCDAMDVPVRICGSRHSSVFSADSYQVFSKTGPTCRTIFRARFLDELSDQFPGGSIGNASAYWGNKRCKKVNPDGAFLPSIDQKDTDTFPAIYAIRVAGLGEEEISDICLQSWAVDTQKEVEALLSTPAIKTAYIDLLKTEEEALKQQNIRVKNIREPKPTFVLAGAKSKVLDTLPSWYSEIYPGGARKGFTRHLKHHSLVCVERNLDVLIVTFDNLSNVDDTSFGREPWAYKFLKDEGHSHLGVIARRKDWYREPGLISALEGLAREGFFKRFSRVVFAGTSMGGFAALSFASLSPGASVIAFSPQSTLDEDIVPWEIRFGMGRLRNWRLSHSDAAFEIEFASQVCVISDPYFELDQRHIDRLHGDNIIKLKAWYSGHFTPMFLRRAEILKPIMSHMIGGTLTPEVFYLLYRQRRHLPRYRRALQEAMLNRGRDALAARVGPAFQAQLREMHEIAAKEPLARKY